MSPRNEPIFDRGECSSGERRRNSGGLFRQLRRYLAPRSGIIARLYPTIFAVTSDTVARSPFRQSVTPDERSAHQNIGVKK